MGPYSPTTGTCQMSPYSSPVSHRNAPAEGELHFPPLSLQPFPAFCLHLGILSHLLCLIAFSSQRISSGKKKCWMLKLEFFQWVFIKQLRQFLINITLNIISSQEIHLCIIRIIYLQFIQDKCSLSYTVTVFSDCSRSRFSVTELLLWLHKKYCGCGLFKCGGTLRSPGYKNKLLF